MKRDGDYIPFVNSGSYPIRGGNTVQPLVDGEPAFRCICEAVEAAQKSIWVTIAFIEQNIQMPDGRGTFFDVLDQAKDRGLDVRVIFWRHLGYEAMRPGEHFPGIKENREWLKARGSQFLARWDQATGQYCQHQKSWLIDAGEESEIAFVGGINLDTGSIVSPGHTPSPTGSTHDLYIKLQGPVATDVHHNFVQRWNETSDRTQADGNWPDAMSTDSLEFPDIVSRPQGNIPVQIQRTVRRGSYSDTTPTPGAEPFDIAGGERGILDQYLLAIDAAKRTIYIEDQAIGSDQIVDRLHMALERGVEIVFLVPADPNDQTVEARKNPKTREFFESIARLGEKDNFTFVGIAANNGDGEYQNIYVHAKIALIDDVWCTIGSTNIASRSFYGDTELNASLWHEPTVHALRCELLKEHLGRDTSTLNDVEALRLYREIAQGNTKRRQQGAPLQGLAFALNPATYGS
jgi:cardiolipin synthase A/B